ncbi:MAG: NTP transferase domain-containing protein [Candidatus Caenarcaniphilales bacterium]|jgi:capsule biosynthesis phosphatase|nr:NTP transferase domain-containing protein [Candidatus Caenarcaniphilales bacterium]
MLVNYIICAAGEGSRFQVEFPETPKALIKLCGKYLIDWSLESLPIYAGDKIIIITQRKHRIKEKITKHLSEKFKFNQIEFIEIDRLTGGQLDTALLAKPFIDINGAIAIFNCDTFFQSKTLSKLIHEGDAEGIIPCAIEPGEAWSFCEIDSSDLVTAVAEKKRISDWVSVGLYFFRDSNKFFIRAEEYSKSAEVKEKYVAPFYQVYLDQGEKIIIDRVSLFKPMGTPKQIEDYWGLKASDIVQANANKVLVVDIDNTLTIDNPADSYENKKPNMPLIEKLKEYKNLGYQIHLYSSRRMKTYNNDESKIIANIAETTITWLRKHDVPYDGLKFGKPFAENGFYVDDKSIRPNEFIEMSESELLSLVYFEKKLQE